MPLTTTGDLITSDPATRTPRPVPGCPPAWHMTWLPGRLPRPGHRIWPHTGNRAAEPGQTAARAITVGARPPEKPAGTEAAASPPGRQARP